MLNLSSLFNPQFWESPAKLGAGILLALVFLLECRRGYFRNFRRYAGMLSFKPYLLFFGTFLILFFFILSQDRLLTDKIQGWKSPLGAFILFIGRNVGENIKFWYSVIFIYGMARWKRFEKGIDIAFGAILTSALTGILSHLFKFVFMRTRPVGNLGPYSLFNYQDLFTNPKIHQSLPSGDVSLVSGAVAYFFLSFKNPFRWLLLLIPLANAYARISLNKHWPSDTVAAMGLGWMLAYFVWNFKARQKAASIS